MRHQGAGCAGVLGDTGQPGIALLAGRGLDIMGGLAVGGGFAQMQRQAVGGGELRDQCAALGAETKGRIWR